MKHLVLLTLLLCAAFVAADVIAQAPDPGWNLTIPEDRDLQYLGGLVGGFEPFVRTKAERDAAGDMRLSIAERYAGQADYLDKIRRAADDLVGQRFLRREDVPAVLRRAEQIWSLVMAAGAR